MLMELSEPQDNFYYAILIGLLDALVTNNGKNEVDRFALRSTIVRAGVYQQLVSVTPSHTAFLIPKVPNHHITYQPLFWKINLLPTLP